MALLYGTKARLSIRGTDGVWHDMGEVGIVETEMTPINEDVEPFVLPQSFEFTVTLTRQWWAPYALSLPPVGCVPMYN